MPVTQMFVNKATLEDIFLELTGDEIVSESSDKVSETASKEDSKSHQLNYLRDVMEVTNNACYL